MEPYCDVTLLRFTLPCDVYKVRLTKILNWLECVATAYSANARNQAKFNSLDDQVRGVQLRDFDQGLVRPTSVCSRRDSDELQQVQQDLQEQGWTQAASEAALRREPVQGIDSWPIYSRSMGCHFGVPFSCIALSSNPST